MVELILCFYLYFISILGFVTMKYGNKKKIKRLYEKYSQHKFNRIIPTFCFFLILPICIIWGMSIYIIILKYFCWHWQNKRYYIQHSNKFILKLTCNCLEYPYCQTSIHATDRHIFTIQNTKENHTPFLLCSHSYHLFFPTKHLTINNLRRILKMTAIKIRLGFSQ